MPLIAVGVTGVAQSGFEPAELSSRKQRLPPFLVRSVLIGHNGFPRLIAVIGTNCQNAWATSPEVIRVNFRVTENYRSTILRGHTKPSSPRISTDSRGNSRANY